MKILYLSLILCITTVQAQQCFLRADALEEPIMLSLRNDDASHASWDRPLEEVTLKTPNGPIQVLHSKRNSDTVLILGQGLPAPKEEMLRYAVHFDCDIVLFDYRWVHQYGWFLGRGLMSLAPVKKVLLDEEQVVRSVLAYIGDYHYKNVVGLGVCYSNFLFAKIQSDDAKKGRGPFTHLILDSCWYSLTSFAEQIAYDPYLPTSPQYGGAPPLLKKISQSAMGTSLMKITFLFLSNPCTADYLSTINCPVLFIHGINDIMVPLEHFEQLWRAAELYQRAALLTPAPHAGSIAYTSLYTAIVQTFMQSDSIGHFLELLRL